MTTPNENTTETRTPRAGFWLRAIEHRKHVLTREYRKSLGDTARDGISDEDYATTMATLEKMARNLGFDENEFAGERPFGRGRGRGFGPGFGHGRGHRHPGMMRGHAAAPFENRAPRPQQSETEQPEA